MAATPAAAEWREARSKHFIVYSEGKEEAVRDGAARLEQLDALMRLLTRNQAPDDDQVANPMIVYVVGDLEAVRRLHGRGGASSGVGGFYVPRAAGAVAFTPRRTGDTNFNPEYILFHEYGHHFLLGNYAAPYPAWFREGYAEFLATTRFTADRVEFGRVPQHRARGIYANTGMTAQRLFSFGTRRLDGDQNEALYGRGWLLTHHIMFDPARARQFGEYLNKVSGGMPSGAAAESAFGGLGKLDNALDAYLRRNKFTVKQLARDTLTTAPVSVRTMGAGENAMLPLRMRSVRGVDRAAATTLYATAKRVAAPFGGDAVVQGWLAEMAHDAGDDAGAEAAADRALAVDPRSSQALLYKARIRLRRAAAGKAGPEAWKEARGWIVQANRIDPNNAAALQLFYTSFTVAEEPPVRSAIQGLYRASELAPQDPELRWLTARQQIRDSDLQAAKVTLRPLAYDPHAPANNPAARLVALIEGGAKGDEALAALDADGAGAKAGD